MATLRRKMISGDGRIQSTGFAHDRGVVYNANSGPERMVPSSFWWEVLK
jgi:hypothetical protein